VGQLLKRARQQRFSITSQKPAQGRVDLKEAPVGRGERHTDRGCLERAGKARVRQRQPRRGSVVPSHVTRDRCHTSLQAPLPHLRFLALRDVIQKRRKQPQVPSIDDRQHQLDRHLPPTAMQRPQLDLLPAGPCTLARYKPFKHGPELGP
jgi:hypothetical protein